jgi:hypothetical protein
VRLVVGPGEVLVVKCGVVQLHGLCAAGEDGEYGSKDKYRFLHGESFLCLYSPK